MRPLPPLQSTPTQTQKNRTSIKTQSNQQLLHTPQHQARTVLHGVQSTHLRQLQNQRRSQFRRVPHAQPHQSHLKIQLNSQIFEISRSLSGEEEKKPEFPHDYSLD